MRLPRAAVLLASRPSMPKASSSSSSNVKVHPIANGPVVQTSEIYALASDWTWVRTRSRLYRLGQPLGPVGQTSLN